MPVHGRALECGWQGSRCLPRSHGSRLPVVHAVWAVHRAGHARQEEHLLAVEHALHQGDLVQVEHNARVHLRRQAAVHLARPARAQWGLQRQITSRSECSSHGGRGGKSVVVVCVWVCGWVGWGGGAGADAAGLPTGVQALPQPVLTWPLPTVCTAPTHAAAAAATAASTCTATSAQHSPPPHLLGM